MVDQVVLAQQDSSFKVPRNSYRMFEMKRVREKVHVNEIKQVNGQFGWCFVCRNEANLYSIQSRVPICGFECRSILQSRMRELEEGIPRKELQSKIKDKKRELNKGINIVIHLCNLGRSNGSLRSREVQRGVHGADLCADFGVSPELGQAFLGRPENLLQNRKVLSAAADQKLDVGRPEEAQGAS